LYRCGSQRTPLPLLPSLLLPLLLLLILAPVLVGENGNGDEKDVWDSSSFAKSYVPTP
jgi:hypothetical protein